MNCWYTFSEENKTYFKQRVKFDNAVEQRIEEGDPSTLLEDLVDIFLTLDAEPTKEDLFKFPDYLLQ